MRQGTMRQGAFTLLAWAIITGVATGDIPATWTGQSSSLAFGWLNDVSFSASASPGAPFTGLHDGRFDGSSWQADMSFSKDLVAIETQPANAGAIHSFRFTEPVEEGMLLIENFDSNSIATITTMGQDGLLELISASESISFDAVAGNAGRLRTSNSTFDGEGDAVLLFSGAVTGIELRYEGGDGANGVFYGFATSGTQAVPEPSTGTLSVLLALVPLMLRNRREA